MKYGIRPDEEEKRKMTLVDWCWILLAVVLVAAALFLVVAVFKGPFK